MITKVVTGTEPITLIQAKEYLQVDISTDDSLITRMITMARQNVEMFCGISIVDTTITHKAFNYDVPYLLPYSPLKSIESLEIDSEDIDETDTDYVQGEYIVYSGAEMEVVYKTGWTSVPEGLKQAIYELMKLYYDNRGAYIETPATLMATLQIYSRNLII
jgi:hypothetical protein